MLRVIVPHVRVNGVGALQVVTLANGNIVARAGVRVTTAGAGSKRGIGAGPGVAG